MIYPLNIIFYLVLLSKVISECVPKQEGNTVSLKHAWPFNSCCEYVEWMKDGVPVCTCENLVCTCVHEYSTAVTGVFRHSDQCVTILTLSDVTPDRFSLVQGVWEVVINKKLEFYCNQTVYAVRGQAEYTIQDTQRQLLINYTVLVYPEGGSTAVVVDSRGISNNISPACTNVKSTQHPFLSLSCFLQLPKDIIRVKLSVYPRLYHNTTDQMYGTHLVLNMYLTPADDSVKVSHVDTSCAVMMLVLSWWLL
ncbi:uncharacterized protein LOC131941471 [Physella acuta]|uniref:uncharacterized protein LOC131941471 n=1 Tax=Physella acuta TaxID=109671 RepID=UPI0027DCEEBC|nr:uncharacterized protein LOC131941471 [Physella acuta]